MKKNLIVFVLLLMVVGVSAQATTDEQAKAIVDRAVAQLQRQPRKYTFTTTYTAGRTGDKQVQRGVCAINGKKTYVQYAGMTTTKCRCRNQRRPSNANRIRCCWCATMRRHIVSGSTRTKMPIISWCVFIPPSPNKSNISVSNCRLTKKRMRCGASSFASAMPIASF